MFGYTIYGYLVITKYLLNDINTYLYVAIKYIEVFIVYDCNVNGRLVYLLACQSKLIQHPI